MNKKEAAKILGVQCTLSGDAREVVEAYKRLARANHPDKGGSTDDMQRITQAYESFQSNKNMVMAPLQAAVHNNSLNTVKQERIIQQRKIDFIRSKQQGERKMGSGEQIATYTLAAVSGGTDIANRVAKPVRVQKGPASTGRGDALDVCKKQKFLDAVGQLTIPSNAANLVAGENPQTTQAKMDRAWRRYNISRVRKTEPRLFVGPLTLEQSQDPEAREYLAVQLPPPLNIQSQIRHNRGSKRARPTTIADDRKSHRGKNHKKRKMTKEKRKQLKSRRGE